MATTASLTIEGQVARITFENPAGVNILDAGARASLADALTQVEARRDLRALVLQAAGRVFLAGADLKELKQLDAAGGLAYAEAGQALANRIEDLPLVTIAAIHAACAGGGCELSLACDLRIAGQGARIGLPETTLGLLPGWGGSVRTVRDLGLARARRIILSAQLFAAAEAHELGLVHRVVPDAELPAAVQAALTELATRGPQALARAKGLLQGLASVERARGLAAEAQAFAACFAGGEPAEGLAAFLEKRPPQWG